MTASEGQGSGWRGAMLPDCGMRSARTDAPFAEVPLGSLLRRGMMLRCPLCGQRGVRRTYTDFKPSCPRCGLRFDRGEGDYWVGGFLLNFIVAELIVVAAFVGAIAATWPDVPWKAVLYGSLVPAVLGPFLTYPFSRNIWLALDLQFRPPEETDFATTEQDG